MGLPFLASAVLAAGACVRAADHHGNTVLPRRWRNEPVKMPILSTVKNHFGALVAGATCLATFVLFYLMIVFTIQWGTSALGYSKNSFLQMQLIGVVFFALTIPISAVLAERGRKPVMLAITAGIAVFGLFLAPMFQAGHTGALAMLIIGLSLMGLTYGPLGTVLLRVVPDACALHRQLSCFQPGRHLRCVTRAGHRAEAGNEIRSAVCRLLSHRLCAADDRRPARDP